MEFLKIISDDSSMEIIPLNKIFSIKVIMGKLYINGEDKHIKVKNSEEFIDDYALIITTKMVNIPSMARMLCIENVNGYASVFVDQVEYKGKRII